MRDWSRGTGIPLAAPARPPRQAPSFRSPLAEVFGLNEQTRQWANPAVNTELVGLHWGIGRSISAKLDAAVWGKGVIDRLAIHFARTLPGQRGFARRNLFPMCQFYMVSRADEKVTPLVTQLPWTDNFNNLSQCRWPEGRDFNLPPAVQERWGKREPERQFRRGAFERAFITPPRVSAALVKSTARYRRRS